MPETILAIGAHNDDHIIGAGGALIKYVKEGKRFKTVIFSYGEVSHPHLKPEVIVATRIKEAKGSDEMMGGSGITYLGAYDRTFEEDIVKLGLKDKLKEIISEERPSKIFTHAPDDAHPNHRAAHKVVMEAVAELDFKPEVYSYEVWNFMAFKNRNKPKLVVDVSDTYKKKLEAFKAHESQQATIRFLLWKVYVRDYLNGFNNKCRFAEVFIRLN